MIFPLQIKSGKALACSSALLQEVGSEDMMEAVNNKGQTLKCFQRCEHQVSISPTRLSAAFTCPDLKCTKRLSSHQCLFSLLGSAHPKAACKMLVKSTPD